MFPWKFVGFRGLYHAMQPLCSAANASSYMFLHFLQVFSLLCPCRILFLDAYTLCIVHWLSVRHTSDLYWAYWLVCPNVHSKCEWALWSLFYSDCLFGQVMVYFSFLFTWFFCACLICLKSFLHRMIKLCCVLGVTCSYDSRAYQILELGVSKFLFNCSQLTF